MEKGPHTVHFDDGDDSTCAALEDQKLLRVLVSDEVVSSLEGEFLMPRYQCGALVIRSQFRLDGLHSGRYAA